MFGLFLTAWLAAQDPAALVEKLRSGGLEEREEAAQALQALGRAAAPALEKAAADPDAEVASRARALLRRLQVVDLLGPDLVKHAPEVVERLDKDKAPALLKELSDGLYRTQRPHPGLEGKHLDALARLALRDVVDEDQARVSLEICARLGLRSAIPEALAILRGPSADLRPPAASYLLDVAALDGAPEIARLLGDPRPDVRRAAARVLGGLRAAGTAPQLRPLLADPDADTVLEAAQALLRMNDVDSASAFRSLLKQERDEARAVASTGVARWGDESAAPDLIALLAVPKFRDHALRALWATGTSDPAPFLAALKDPDSAAADTACYVVGRLGRREALPTLLLRLRPEVGSGWIAALEAVELLDDPSAGPAVVDLLRRPDKAVREEAARVLGRLRHRPAAPALLEALKDPEAAVRRQAVEALARLEAPEAVGPLRGLLKDPERPVREAALEALSVLGGEEVVPGVLPLLADPALEERAIRLLRRRVSLAAEPELWALLEAKAPAVRATAVALLARARSPRAAAALLRVPEGLERVERDDLVALFTAASPAEVRDLLQVKTEWAFAMAARRRDARALAPVFMEVFRAESAVTRAGAATALLALDATDALPEARDRLRKGYDQNALRLVAGLGSPDDLALVRSHFARDPWRAVDALRRWGDREHVPTLLAWLRGERAVDALLLIRQERLTEAAPAVEAQLDHADEDVRDAAVRVLGELGATAAVPAIDKRLDDPSEAVRERAAETLVELLGPERPAEIAALLPRVPKTSRSRVVAALRACGGPAQGPALAALLTDADLDLARFAAGTLARLGARDQAPAIVPLLRHESEETARDAARALGRLGAPEALEPLLARLGSDDDDAREALAGLPADLLRPRLLALASRDHDDIRRHVAALLGRVGGPAAKDALVRMLMDEDEDVQGAAAEALARMKAADAAPRIRRLLRIRHVGVSTPHEAAVRALAALGDRASIPEIRRLLRSPVAGAAVDALAALDAREAAPDLRALVERGDGAAGEAARALAGWGVEEARPAIRRLIPADARMMAAAARLKDREAAAVILAQLERRDWPDPRAAALRALAELGAAEAAPRIRALLGTVDEQVREAAADALARLDRAALAAALADRDPGVRRAAARGLCRAGFREGVPVLLQEETGSLFVLHALRSPAAWAALREARPAGRSEPSTVIQVLWDAVGRPVRGHPARWVLSSSVLDRSAVEIIEGTFHEPGLDALLEKDGLRIVTSAEARAFWAAWWESTK